MKLIMYFEDSQYSMVVDYFISSNLHYSSKIVKLDNKSDISDFREYILLTDSQKIYDEALQNIKYILCDYESGIKNMIYKFQPFDEIINRIFAENNLEDGTLISSSIKLISISSLYGGAGKSTILYHLSNYLNIQSTVAIYNGFNSSSKQDLKQFILDMKYLDKKDASWFVKKSYCNNILPSFRDIKDYWDISFNEIYGYISDYLRKFNIEYLIVEIDDITSEFAKSVFEKASINLIVDNMKFYNLKKIQNLEEVVLNRYLGSSKHIFLKNMDEVDTMLSLPFENNLYEFSPDGFKIIESSNFNLKLIKILKGVLNV